VEVPGFALGFARNFAVTHLVSAKPRRDVEAAGQLSRRRYTKVLAH